jgi:RimJ/RimL family protein N-acetyltransferase
MDVFLRRMQPEDLNQTWLMYLSFEPKGHFQGLPPVTPEQTREWLQTLVRKGATQFVLEVGERVIGHSVLCPGPQAGEAELAIFLHQDYRGRGLGKRLLLATLHYGCKQLELSRVWLSVQTGNTAALECFKSVGFVPVAPVSPLTWELDLQRPSHCEHCRGDQCPAFRETLPRILVVPHQRRHKPDRLS